MWSEKERGKKIKVDLKVKEENKKKSDYSKEDN
jgi:hypothetical protein